MPVALTKAELDAIDPADRGKVFLSLIISELTTAVNEIVMRAKGSEQEAQDADEDVQDLLSDIRDLTEKLNDQMAASTFTPISTQEGMQLQSEIQALSQLNQ